MENLLKWHIDQQVFPHFSTYCQLQGFILSLIMK